MGALIDRYRGPLLAAAVLTVILLGSVNGAFSFLNGPVYDFFSGLGEEVVGSRTPALLVVELDPDSAHADEAFWTPFLDALEARGPRQILLATLPRVRDRSLYERLSAMRAIVGRHAFPDAETGRFHLEEWPHDAERVLEDFAVLAPPIVENGVYRYAPTGLRVDGSWRPSLEVRGAEAVGARVPTGDRYQPSFVGMRGAIARIDAERVLAGDLTSSLVSGKTLLVVPRGEAGDLGLYVPGELGGTHATLAEFRAIALAALLQEDTVATGGLGATTILVLVVGLGCLVFYQRAGLALSVYFIVTAIGVLVLLAWATLVYLSLWLPFAELIATLLGSWAVVLNRKYLQEQTALVRELNRVSLLMQNRLVPESVLEAPAYWAQIGRMVYQLLELKRSIFLEAIEGEHRVAEIHAIDCEITDIDERRRDYERAPYTDAIRARGPLAVSGYLKGGSAAEQQFLTPLMIEGRVLGFWAFGVDASATARIAEFRRVIVALAEQMAELLEQRQELVRQRARARGFRDYLTLQGGHYLSNDLRQALALSNRRLATVEEVFRGLHTAALLYEPFGRLLLANDASTSLLAAREIRPFDLTSVDMVVALTGVSPDAARTMLSDVVLNAESRSLPTRAAGSGAREYVLRVRALRQRQRDTGWDGVPGEGAPFSLIGILCELVDYTAISEERHLKETLLDRLERSTAAARAKVDAPSLAPYFDFVQRTREYLSRDLATRETDAYPVDCASIVRSAITERGPAAAASRKRVELRDDDRGALVIAARAELKRLLGDTLDFLLTDTRPEGCVRVAIETSVDRVRIGFDNDGIGLPEVQLARYMNGDTTDTTDAIAALREARLRVADWGGELDIASEVGRGFRMTLDLARFAEPPGLDS